MMKRLFLLVMLSAGILYPQEKYLIYFKDKGIEKNSALSKRSGAYRAALSQLSERAVSRRIKTAGEDSLITYEDLPLNTSYLAPLADAGIKIENELKWFNAVSAYLTQEQINYLRTQSFVERLEKVKRFVSGKNLPAADQYQGLYKAAAGDSLFYGYSWRQLKMSDIPQVHAKGFTGAGVIMGVLDSGFGWKDHDVFGSINVLKEYDFVNKDAVTVNQDNDRSDQDGHGTFVLSIIGGYSPQQFIGGAYRSSFLLAKTEDVPTERHVEEDNYARALEWMEAQGVDITTSSLGYNTFDDPEKSYEYKDMNGRTTIVTRAAELAFRRGVLVLSAAGNEGDDPWFYIAAPADGINVIAVGALSTTGNAAGFSSRGPSSDGRVKPDISALGSPVWGANAHSKISFSASTGTSLSTPIAASAAALLLQAHPYLNNRQARIILLEAGLNSASPDYEKGYGLISAVRAIEFPNLQISGSGYVLHKTFLDSSALQGNSLKLFYSADSVNYSMVSMTQGRPGFYTSDFPKLPVGTAVRFFFRYTDNKGNAVTEPASKQYTFIYGDPVIYRNLDKNLTVYEEQMDFVLSQNYPNPFNIMTRIDFMAAANEQARLYILNAIGEKVRDYERTAVEGLNSIIWDGRNEAGAQCASGVYYYILRLSGRDYGKKMLLIK